MQSVSTKRSCCMDAGRFHLKRDRNYPYCRGRVYVVRATMSTIAITPEQERILELINARLDELDTAATPSVTSILNVAHRLPAADRIYVHRRLMAIGSPKLEWASTIR
jgi:hypothetical protein